MKPSRVSRARRRVPGYTVVELMMALAVFATGVTGVIAMQRATVTANQLGKNIGVANGIAEAWLGQLAADGTRWQTTVGGTMAWLGTVNNANMNGAWQLPDYDSTRNFGPGFDPLGAPMAVGGDFCAHIRLTWLYRDATAGGRQGNGLIRTEVRVFWPRDGATRVTGDCTSTAPLTIAAISAAIQDGTYHVVTQASAVRQPSGLW